MPSSEQDRQAPLLVKQWGRIGTCGRLVDESSGAVTCVSATDRRKIRYVTPSQISSAPAARKTAIASQKGGNGQPAASHAFCVGMLDLAFVSTTVRSVLNSGRRTHPPVSANLRRKPPLIARRYI